MLFVMLVIFIKNPTIQNAAIKLP